MALHLLILATGGGCSFVSLLLGIDLQNLTLDRLVFSILPPKTCLVGTRLPMFEVQGTPRLDQEVELFVTNGSISGTTVKRLVPNGTNPSYVRFDDIVFDKLPGSYTFEVRSRQNPAISTVAPHRTTAEFKVLARTALEVLFSDYARLVNF
eukprot:m.79799 g.79799  ORF g.79799 m.79799 type:complete len:151 (+) comp8193_c0_seq2:1791-2243(+)